jgi:hypothetical protein
MFLEVLTSSIPMFHTTKREPTTRYDIESASCTFHPHSLFPYDPFLSSHLFLGLLTCLLIGFPTKIVYAFFDFPIPNMHCKLFDFTTLTTLSSHVTRAVPCQVVDTSNHYRENLAFKYFYLILSVRHINRSHFTSE